MALKFVTISADLLEYAELAAAAARQDGYRLVAEPAGAYFPVTPTILGSAAQRELIVEVVSRVSFAASRRWLAYGRAQRKETRVLIVSPPQKKNIPVAEIEKFQAAGIGLSIGNDGHLVSLVQPRDLATQIVCPDISTDSKKVKKKLAPCFGKIDRGDIVDGFKDAAVVVESAARRHLVEGVKSGRIKFASASGKPIVYAVKDINKGTMGWLRDRFGEIVKPNEADKVAFQAFAAVVPDRNLASHNEMTAAQRRAVHARVAKHLLVLHQAARKLI